MVRWPEGATVGKVVAGGNGAGDGPGQLFFPSRIAVSRSGALFVCDTGNGRVTRWDPGSLTGEVVARGAGLLSICISIELSWSPAVHRLHGPRSRARALLVLLIARLKRMPPETAVSSVLPFLLDTVHVSVPEFWSLEAAAGEGALERVVVSDESKVRS